MRYYKNSLDIFCESGSILTMNASQIVFGTVLVPNGIPLHRAISAGIQCIAIMEQGFRFRRMNLYYNREEFFLTSSAIETSNWIIPQTNFQTCFL